MKKTITSVWHASHGMLHSIRNERNFRIQFVCACITIAAAVFLGVSRIEWCILLLCIALVLSLEMLNTAIEHLCNFIHSEYHDAVRIVKDVSAGAVLLSALLSAITGAIIFIPKIIFLINSIKVK